MLIKIFSTEECPACNMAKEWLKKNNEEFYEIDIMKDKTAYKELEKIFGDGEIIVPVTAIGQQIVIGFDEKTFESTILEEKIRELYEEYKKYAKEKGIKLNSKRNVVEGIIKKLIENEKKYGKRYCPCKPQKTDDTICPCKNHLKEIEEMGHCTCYLFVKGDENGN